MEVVFGTINGGLHGSGLFIFYTFGGVGRLGPYKGYALSFRSDDPITQKAL
jgi:hypothetical protein